MSMWLIGRMRSAKTTAGLATDIVDTDDPLAEVFVSAVVGMWQG